MRTFGTPAAMVLSLALGATVASAQSSRPHYRRSVQATVDLVDQQSRIVELKRPEGFYVRLHVPETFTTLDSIKVGQTINVIYYEAVIRQIDKAGAEAHNREPVTPPKTSEEAHGSPDLLRKVTVTIAAVDAKLGTVSYTDSATDRMYSARTEKPDMAKKVAAGDKVDLTYSQATLFEVK
jgi:hypothetical protein